MVKAKYSARMVISGLKEETHLFAESMREQSEAFLEKASDVLSDVENLTIHVKSTGKGNARKFELYSFLSLKKATLHAKASGRKLNLVLRDLFDKLLREARKQKSFRDKGKKHREHMVEPEI